MLNKVYPAMVERTKEEWRTEFEQLSARRGPLAPKLVFLPARWPAANVAFAYFNVIAIGPGLLRAPPEVRRYLLAHELGHIERRHTLGQVGYWASVLAAVAIGQMLPTGLAMAPIMAVLIAAVAWLSLGETRREFEADDAAAARFGDQTVINGLTWMQARRSEPASKLCTLRLDRRRAQLRASLARGA
jgi:Zn-dependent protease with chaperone function